jgi:uncharacterized membrane protein YbhN (UPF0104 family)
MTRQNLLTSIGSCLLAIALLVALLLRVNLDFAALGRLFAAVRAEYFAVIVFLVAASVFLASEKWRLVDVHLAQSSLPRSRAFYVTLTGLGQACGQVLPTQLALVLSRSVGTWMTQGGGSRRSVVGTVLEQAFDLLAVLIFIVPSVVALVLGGFWSWVAVIGAAGVLAFVGVAPVMRGFGRLAGRLRPLSAAGPLSSRGRLRHACLGIVTTLNAGDIALARRLLAISFVRFFVLCLMASATSRAGGFDVPDWHLAVALPVVVLATAFPLTPGGIGVNEWTFVTALVALGAPTETAVQWAVLNRVLVCAASLIVGAMSGAVALFFVVARGAGGNLAPDSRVFGDAN